jgi:hypothetical protein
MPALVLGRLSQIMALSAQADVVAEVVMPEEGMVVEWGGRKLVVREGVLLVGAW